MDLGNFPSPGATSVHSILILICGQLYTKQASPTEDECPIRFSVSSNSSIGSRIIRMGVLIC